MRQPRQNLILLVVVAVACSSAPDSGPAAKRVPGYTVFTVAGTGDIGVLGGVTVQAILRNGEVVELGTTDSLGSVEVPTELLQPSRASYVVLCGELFFCGAVRVDQLNLDYGTYVTLAPFAI